MSGRSPPNRHSSGSCEDKVFVLALVRTRNKFLVDIGVLQLMINYSKHSNVSLASIQVSVLQASRLGLS